MNNRNIGFTLIELLVVVSIIGLLSSIVLSSLSTAKSKGRDSAVQGQLNGIKASAEMYYASHSWSFGAATTVCGSGMFTDTVSGMKKLVDATTNINCRSNGNLWMVYAPLLSDATKYWCVDSDGASRRLSSAPAAGVYACPAAS